jgi:hypothetical protein
VRLAYFTEREIERLIEAASKNRRGHRDVEAGVVRDKGPEHNLRRLVLFGEGDSLLMRHVFLVVGCWFGFWVSIGIMLGLLSKGLDGSFRAP